MRKFKIFKLMSRMFEGKTTEELMSIKSGLALIYAFCATNALMYFVHLAFQEAYPTDAEKLKAIYGKKTNENIKANTIRITGLQQMEIINNQTVNETELLDEQ